MSKNSLTNYLHSQLAEFRPIPTGVLVLLAAYSLVAFGSPMPPQITWLEIVMSCGLLLGGIMLAGSVLQVAIQNKRERWALILAVSLFFVPLIWGLFLGNSQRNIVRDVIPFLFLIGLPILLTYQADHTLPNFQVRLILAALVLVGIITSVLCLLVAAELYGSLFEFSRSMNNAFSGVAQTASSATTTALGRAALVLSGGVLPTAKQILFLKLFEPALFFSSIFIGSWGVVFVAKSWRSALLGIALLGYGMFIAYEFMALSLRAYVALFLIALLCVSATQFRRWGFYTRVLPLVAIAAALFWPQITVGMHTLLAKQQIAGTNHRGGEWSAVFSTLVATPQTLLIGTGWGGTLENPIYKYSSDDHTRFTHSVLSFFLLKTGIVGLIMFVSTMLILIMRHIRAGCFKTISLEKLILLLSCIPPLLIGALLEPIYKTLSYGLILALFMLALSLTDRKTP